MGALLRKEWREHRWVLLGAWLFGAIMYVLLFRGAARQASPLIAYQRLVMVMLPLFALLFAQRLVTREYSGRSQLFLETLPVSRLQVLAVKWCAGAAMLYLGLACALGAALWVARAQVTLTPQFVGLIAARSAAYVLFVHALSFLLGLTGRYRFVLAGGLVMLAGIANDVLQLPFAQWPPILLVGEAMVLERLVMPFDAVLITCALGAAFTGAAFALALAAEGSLVAALARKMTAREKVAVTVSATAAIFALTSFDVRKAKPPFAMRGAVHSSGVPDVAVAYAPGALEADSAALADTLSADLLALQRALALPVTPSLSVLHDAALDPDVFLRAGLRASDGVVLRAAFDQAQFGRDDFRAYAIGEWLDWYTLALATREERRWLHAGYAQWTVARGAPARAQLLTMRAAVAATLLWRRHVGLERALAEWGNTREQLGGCLSDALAWRAVSELEQGGGAARFAQVSRALLGQRPPNDARATFLPGLAAELARAGAPGVPQLAARLDARLRADQQRLAAELAPILLPAVVFKAVPLGDRVVEIHYAIGAEAPPGRAFSVRYAALWPWAADLSLDELTMVDASAGGVLPATFNRGERAFMALDWREPRLGCTIRLAGQRRELE